MKPCVKTFTLENGKLVDVFWWQDHTFSSALSFSVYEVKNPNRKRFGRNKFFSLNSGWNWIDKYKTLDDFLNDILKRTNEKVKYKAEISKRMKEFTKTP